LAQDRRLVPPRSPYTFHSQPLQQWQPLHLKKRPLVADKLADGRLL
jgi:hypothetical protein